MKRNDLSATLSGVAIGLLILSVMWLVGCDESKAKNNSEPLPDRLEIVSQTIWVRNQSICIVRDKQTGNEFVAMGSADGAAICLNPKFEVEKK